MLNSRLPPAASIGKTILALILNRQPLAPLFFQTGWLAGCILDPERWCVRPIAYDARSLADSKHPTMRFVALVSGGKDSVFSLGKAMAHGHELVCLANLYPPDTGPEELDSFMFQSAGAPALEALGECLGVPLLRAPLRGGSGHQGLHYTVTEGDEVEDLYDLIRHVKVRSIGRSGGWVE